MSTLRWKDNSMIKICQAWFLFVMLVVFSIQNAAAQNLVENPGFEEIINCPDDYSQLFTTESWSTPNWGTSDYFSNCADTSQHKAANTPSNFIGHQTAFAGAAYAGLYAFYKGNYREYIQGRLLEPLVKGQKYCARFYVSLADTTGLAVGRLGVAFSEGQVMQHTFHPIDIESVTATSDMDILNCKDVWVELRAEYIAMGGEQHVIIGNFMSNEMTDTMSLNRKGVSETEFWSSYYYIDNVCVAPILEDGSCGCGFMPSVVSYNVDCLEVNYDTDFSENRLKGYISPSEGDVVFLKNVHFNKGKASFSDQEAAVTELDLAVRMLKRHPEAHVLVSGHTDQAVPSRLRKGLSKARAESVYYYFIRSGVPRDQIRFEGVGDSKPLVDHRSKNATIRNNRVELIIESPED